MLSQSTSFVNSLYHITWMWLFSKTETHSDLIGSGGFPVNYFYFGDLSSQAPTHQETYLAVHFHVSLVSHQWPFSQAKCWNWAILPHFKINQHLLWWSFIPSSLTSHLHLSLHLLPSLPLLAPAPEKCMVSNLHSSLVSPNLQSFGVKCAPWSRALKVRAW